MIYVFIAAGAYLVVIDLRPAEADNGLLIVIVELTIETMLTSSTFDVKTEVVFVRWLAALNLLWPGFHAGEAGVSDDDIAWF